MEKYEAKMTFGVLRWLNKKKIQEIKRPMILIGLIAIRKF